jgi:hypothetical protein
MCACVHTWKMGCAAGPSCICFELPEPASLAVELWQLSVIVAHCHMSHVTVQCKGASCTRCLILVSQLVWAIATRFFLGGGEEVLRGYPPKVHLVA